MRKNYAVIAAGGLGTRLKNFKDNHHTKVLIDIDGMSMISTQINQLKDKYTKIIKKFDGNIVKTEDWGLMQLSYIIKNNKKGNFIHFKLEGHGKMINELEKNEKIDKNLLRYLTVKVKKFDLEENFFNKIEKQDKLNNDEKK